ncbi:MAG: hypothetical protein JO069_07085 [Verrucomicrobia bacterium]|nr:hypothetical protein [Verrucomicrobiota bacterium]
MGNNAQDFPAGSDPVRFELVSEPGALRRVWPGLREPAGALALDLETYGDRPADALDPHRGEIRLLTVMRPGAHPVVFDLKALGYGATDWAGLFAGRQVIGHNLHFDAAWLLEKLGARLTNMFCTWSAAKLLSNGDARMSNALGPVLERFLGVTVPKALGVSDWGSLMLTEGQLEYAARDVAHLHALADRLTGALTTAGLRATFDLEMALLPVVVGMEAVGMPVDREKLAQVLAEAEASRKGHEAELKACLGPWVNVDSPKQLREAFEGLGVELPNTNEDTLKACPHAAAKTVLAYRASEVVRRQAGALLEAVTPSGRIHGRFNPLGTETGRFSSSDPNLQNIVRGPLRGCFGPSESDRVLVVADYSQIELRVAAWLAGDQTMVEAFQKGQDLHVLTAATVLNKPAAEVTKADRQLAKAVNFGLLYGQSAAGLVRYARTNYGVELAEAAAARIRREFFKHYRGLAAWHRSAREKGAETTEGRTVIGRRRLLGEGASDWERFQAQVNYVVQGSCADGLKCALVDLAAQLPSQARLIGTVHDEVLVECPRADAYTVLTSVREAMLEACRRLFEGLSVEVEGKLCETWADK